MANAKLTEAAHGIYVIAATPFTDSVALDLDSTDRLMDFYLDTGVHGVTILGVMGEAPKLSAAEQTTFMQRALQRIGARVPVIVGVSNPGLDNLSALAQDAMANGAAGVMVAPVAGLKTDDQVYAYLANVLNRLGPDIPVCLQDYPPVTMVHMSVTTINRLIDDFPQLVMFKHEDAPGLRKLSQLCQSADQGRRRVSILTANGGIHIPQEWLRGGAGAMTGFAFPDMLVEMYRRFRAGDVDAMEDLYDLYLPVLRHEQQPGVGLAVRKAILRRRGALSSAATRQPGPSLDSADQAELDRLLVRLRHKLEAAGEVVPAGL